MYQNKSKFEEQLLRKNIDKHLGLPLGGDSSKVHQAAVRKRIDQSIVTSLMSCGVSPSENLWVSTIILS